MKIIAANWKLYKGPKEAEIFFSEFTSLLNENLQSKVEVQVLVFPPALALTASLAAKLKFKCSGKDAAILIGGQNCYSELEGAFTGENSAKVLKEIGADWVLLGHSERRKLFAEDDELIAKKFTKVQELGLKPMLCIGETLQEREAGQTPGVIERQLTKGLHSAKGNNFAIAYEPVWAIGTGKVATLEQVAEAHAQVRSQLTKMGFSSEVAILYGGSVKPDNAKALIRVPEVSGFLVGGASLEPQSFFEICNSVSFL